LAEGFEKGVGFSGVKKKKKKQPNNHKQKAHTHKQGHPNTTPQICLPVVMVKKRDTLSI